MVVTPTPAAYRRTNPGPRGRRPSKLLDSGFGWKRLRLPRLERSVSPEIYRFPACARFQSWIRAVLF